MHCTDAKEYLYEYHTGRLDEQIRQEVEAHLAACPACRQALEELKIDLKLLDHARPPRLSEGFKERVMRGIDQPKVIPFRRRQAYKYVLQGTVAAVVVLAVAVTFIIKSQHPQEPVVRGEKASPISAECAKAVELYNKGTTTPYLHVKEHLFKEALSCNCADKKILARIKNNLADCFEKQGREQEAVNLYRAAMEDDPSLAYPYISLAEYYAKTGDTPAAIRHYEKALELLRASARPDPREIDRIQAELHKLQGGEEP